MLAWHWKPLSPTSNMVLCFISISHTVQRQDKQESQDYCNFSSPSSGMVCGGQAMKLFPLHNSKKIEARGRLLLQLSTSRLIYCLSPASWKQKLCLCKHDCTTARRNAMKEHNEVFDPTFDVKEKINIRKIFSLFFSSCVLYIHTHI